MTQLILDLSISLDGYVAGPNQSLEDPLGVGGRQLHEWAFAAEAWRESHGLGGGEKGLDSEVVAESIENVGATVMGRKMYSGGEGPWENDPNARGWWGDEPPFHHPVFVLTHHEREPLEMEGGTTFTYVTDGIESALEQALAAAEGRDVRVGGGAQAAQQYLRAGLLDRLHLHLVPVLLGAGERLFDGEAAEAHAKLDCTSVRRSPTGVAHLLYEVERS
jgi:dihydrofolate reductase